MKHLAHLSEIKGIGHAIFLSPPFLHCINPCCRRRGIPLTIHHTPVKVTVFTSSGPLPGCKIALRCSACSVCACLESRDYEQSCSLHCWVSFSSFAEVLFEIYQQSDMYIRMERIQRGMLLCTLQDTLRLTL